MAKPKRKWLRRILAVLFGIVLGLAILTLWGYHRATTDPDYFRAIEWDEARLADAANSATQKLAAALTWAGEARSAQVRGVDPSGALHISFSEEEINAFFTTWQRLSGWEKRLGQYMEHPQARLIGSELVVAARVREVGVVISAHFQPVIDSEGRLDFRLKRTLGGRLPIPRVMFSSYLDRARAGLHRALPAMQKDAALDPRGNANERALLAGFTRMALDVIDDRPSDPRVILQADPFNGKIRLPVRLNHVSVEDGQLHLTAEALTPDQQRQFIDFLRQPVNPE